MTEQIEQVQNISLNELHPFKDHPFKTQNNEELNRLIESIKKVGAITPALARPRLGGGFEIVSGHRRLLACKILELKTMPVIVREMTDDEAIIAMVDANLQREQILPSEKAFAYKMKLDAIKHQGKTSVQVAEKLLSVEKVADESGESKDQIRRYIRLTHLIPELLSVEHQNPFFRVHWRMEYRGQILRPRKCQSVQHLWHKPYQCLQDYRGNAEPEGCAYLRLY